jgi:hypothetical protein
LRYTNPAGIFGISWTRFSCVLCWFCLFGFYGYYCPKILKEGIGALKPEEDINLILQTNHSNIKKKLIQTKTVKSTLMVLNNVRVVIQKVQSSLHYFLWVAQFVTNLIVYSIGSNGIVFLLCRKIDSYDRQYNRNIELKYKFDRCYLTTKSDEIYLPKILCV